MGLTNDLATALEAEISGITSIAAHSSTPVDAIPQTPFLYVGPPKGTILGGSWEEREYHFPMRCAIGRTTEDRDQIVVNDLLDLIVAAFRTGISLGALAASALVLTFDTDTFFTLGAADYQAILFEVQVIVMSGQTYVP